MAERHKQSIQERLKYDESLYLDYGIPLETIPYSPIKEIKVDYWEPESALNSSYDLVEEQKNIGKPGAFVTRQIERKEDEMYEIITVWGWQD